MTNDLNVKADGRPLNKYSAFLDCPICSFAAPLRETPDVFCILTCPRCNSEYLTVAVYLTPRQTIGLSLIPLSQRDAFLLRHARDFR
jgi:hypothetical protein